MTSTALPEQSVAERARPSESVAAVFRSSIHPPITMRAGDRRRTPDLAERAVPIDSGEFRRVLGHVPTGVVVVTTMNASAPVGIAIGAFLSISLDPPLVGFFLDNRSGSLPLFTGRSSFCVNVLGADEAQLGRNFSRPVDRFANVAWLPGTSGNPALEGAIAWIECEVEETLRLGDHTLVTGAVQTLSVNDREADPAGLVFYRGGFFGVDGTPLPLDQDGART